MIWCRHLSVCVASALAFSTVAFAQTQLFRFEGPTDDTLWGQQVAAVGDVDNDGVPDVAASCPYGYNPSIDSGLVQVFSGSTGNVILEIVGAPGERYLGKSIAGVGDTNYDGHADILVGIPQVTFKAQEARAVVYSGADGSVLVEVSGDPDDYFARYLSGIGDIDADGAGDFVVGEHEDDTNGTGSGAAWVYSGATGTLLHTFYGVYHGDWFGYTSCGVGDVNLDGHDDYLIGCHQAANWFFGYARLYSGADGQVLHEFVGNSNKESFARAMAGVGDVSGDGIPDFLITAPGWPPGPESKGKAFVYSGADYSVLHKIVWDTPDDFFGQSVSGLGDIDRDGLADFMICARDYGPNGAEFGLVRAYSGVDARPLFDLVGDVGHARLGWDCASAGDLNQDGFPELLLGAPGDGDHGAVFVYSPCPLPTYTYCRTVPNSQTLGALIGSEGTTSISADDLELWVVDGIADQFGLFFYGPQQVEVPFGEGFKCVGGGSLHRFLPPITLDYLGAGQIAVDFTAPPAGSGPGKIEPGSTWNFQFWFRDPAGGGSGFNLSNALSGVFCP